MTVITMIKRFEDHHEHHLDNSPVSVGGQFYATTNNGNWDDARARGLFQDVVCDTRNGYDCGNRQHWDFVHNDGSMLRLVIGL